MPVGTVISDADTGELIADLDHDGARALLAKGGKGGLGNLHFKSSVNRAPRQFTPGEAGEQAPPRARTARCSPTSACWACPTPASRPSIRAVSAARPKVADYPFTTLHPHLGVVRVDDGPQLRHRRHPRADRGRGRGRGARAPVPAAPAAHAAAAASGRHRAVRPGCDPVREAKAIVEELKQVRPGAATTSRAGWC